MSGRHCAVCPAAVEGESASVALAGRPATIVLRLCARHVRTAFRALSGELTAELDDDVLMDLSRRRRLLNPWLYEALDALKAQAANETNPGPRRMLEQAIAERKVEIAAQEADMSIDFLLWEME